jgi:hypothetical protein
VVIEAKKSADSADCTDSSLIVTVARANIEVWAIRRFRSVSTGSGGARLRWLRLPS